MNFVLGGLPSLRNQYALEPGGLLVFSLVRINVHITVCGRNINVSSDHLVIHGFPPSRNPVHSN